MAAFWLNTFASILNGALWREGHRATNLFFCGFSAGVAVMFLIMRIIDERWGDRGEG